MKITIVCHTCNTERTIEIPISEIKLDATEEQTKESTNNKIGGLIK